MNNKTFPASDVFSRKKTFLYKNTRDKKLESKYLVLRCKPFNFVTNRVPPFSLIPISLIVNVD